MFKQVRSRTIVRQKKGEDDLPCIEFQFGSKTKIKLIPINLSEFALNGANEGLNTTENSLASLTEIQEAISQETFVNLMRSLELIAADFDKKFESLSSKTSIEQVNLEFGLGITSDNDVIIAKSNQTINFKINVKWKKLRARTNINSEERV